MAEKIPILFIGSIYDFNVSTKIDRLEIWDKINLSTEPGMAADLVPDNLIPVIGKLEYNTLIGGQPFFYAIDYQEVTNQNKDDVLSNYMSSCELFLHHLWKVRDHCANMMMCYLVFPYSGTNTGIYLTTGSHVVIHSNCLSTVFSKASGLSKSLTTFSKREITDSFNNLENDNLIRPSFIDAQEKPSHLSIEMGRSARANTFIQLARMSYDLGIKISMYCTALESLFGTDNSELSNKLGHRVSFFLESDARRRSSLLKTVKKIYAIRSKVVHGSSLKKEESRLKETAKQADDLLRILLNKIDNEPGLDKFYRRLDSDREYAKFLENLTLGIESLDDFQT